MEIRRSPDIQLHNLSKNSGSNLILQYTDHKGGMALAVGHHKWSSISTGHTIDWSPVSQRNSYAPEKVEIRWAKTGRLQCSCKNSFRTKARPQEAKDSTSRTFLSTHKHSKWTAHIIMFVRWKISIYYRRRHQFMANTIDDGKNCQAFWTDLPDCANHADATR